MLMAMDDEVDPSETHDQFKQIDTNNDGLISFKDFKKFLLLGQ